MNIINKILGEKNTSTSGSSVEKSNVGVKGFKYEKGGFFLYTKAYINENRIIHGGNLDNMIASLKACGVEPEIENEELYHKIIILNRKIVYAKHCKILGVENDKSEESYANEYTEIPTAKGDWAIMKFDDSETITGRRKNKDKILELVDILNKGGEFPNKIHKNNLVQCRDNNGNIVNWLTGEIIGSK